MDPRVARRTDRYAQFAVAAADQAAAEADLAGCDPDRIAVIIGTGVGGLITLQENCESFLERGERGVSPNFVPMMMPNAAAGAGRDPPRPPRPRLRVASACATGAHAIGEAMRMIERGAADVVVAGGTEAALTSLCIAAFRRMGALSSRRRLAPVRRPPRRLRDGRGRGGADPRARGARARARRRRARPRRRLRRLQRRLRHGPARRGRRRRAARDAGRARRRRRDARPTSASSPPTAPARRSTTASSRSRSARCSAPTRRRSPRPSRRSGTCSAPPARPRRSSASRRCGAACCRRRSTTRCPTPTATSTTSPTARARRPGVRLALSNSFGFGGQNACLAFAAA